MPNKYINKLEGKRILVFGGTSGIGFGVVEACLEHGATIIITGSNEPKLEKTITRLTSTYPDIPRSRIITYACDLADVINQESNIKSLLEAVTDNGKTKINHIVFTAGGGLNRIPISEITAEQFQKSQMIRLLGPMIIAKHLPKYIELYPDSSYTLTTGVNIQKPMKGWSTTVPVGGAVETLARALAVDLAPVRVNIVSPGAIKTELLNGVPEGVLDAWSKATTGGRLGRPEDVAEAYLYCMKDGFTTGGIIQSNGGRLLVD